MRAKWAVRKQGIQPDRGRITRRADPRRDPARLRWIRGLPCALRIYPLPRATPCRGRIDPHHPTGAGLALTDDDANAYPMCRAHHDALHDLKGEFEGWVKRQHKDWQRRMTAAYQRLESTKGTNR